jgi:hypothetical protein
VSWGDIVSPECRKLLKLEAFISLEGHLPKDLLNQIRHDRTTVVGADFPRRRLSEEVAKLEKSWGLV